MIIQSFLCIFCAFLTVSAEIWTSYRPGSGYGNRNEFVIEEAVSDDSFVLGEGVYSWKSIKHRKHAYAVGLMSGGLTIIKAAIAEDKNRFIVNHTVYDLQRQPKDIALHGCWNKKLKSFELILAVAVFNDTYEVSWYKIRDDLKIEQFWCWPICKKIHQLEFFKQDRSHKVLLITESAENVTNADIYEFSVHQKNFWLSQSIPLANPTNSSAVSTSGPHYYLSIPQKSANTVVTFRYSRDHFVPFKNISCKNADYVASFKVSFKSYLAVAGDSGAIFEFHGNGLRKIEVEGSDLEGVRFWFPIPVNNFREEVVLLAQRKLETETHSSWHLEAVLHNENTFTLHEEFHCKFHGEAMTGLRCMADEDRDNGIVGLATLSLGRTLGLLVPRAGNAPSGLLMLRTTMKSLSGRVEEEVAKVDETRAELERLLKRHGTRGKEKVVGSSWIGPAEAAFQEGEEWILEDDFVDMKIRDLELGMGELKMEVAAAQRRFNDYLEWREGNKFDTLVLRGNAEVEGEARARETFAKNINNEDANNILNNIAAPDNVNRPLDSKTIDNLKVENLHFDSVNGIPAQALVFAKENPLIINGDVTFEGAVDVKSNVVSKSGKFNGIVLDQEVVTTGKENEGALSFDHVKIKQLAQINVLNRMPVNSSYLKKISPVSDLSNLQVLALNNLYIPVSMNVRNVNGEDFESFLGGLVMKNMNINIPGTVILEGDLEITDSSTVNYLNDKKFPSDFLLTGARRSFVKISGKKHFTNISANEITTKLLNGVNPEHIITLSNNQTIPANVTFKNFEITERLFVDDDKVVDENLLKYRPSLTLKQTNVVKSNLSFHELEIDGTLTILNRFNKTDFGKLLSSVLYKDDASAEITAVKEFPRGLSVLNNIDIKSKTINDIPLEDFIVKDTDDDMFIKNLKGNVTFENLHIKGLYDSVNVTKLDTDSVKTFGEQYLPSPLKFDELEIHNLRINKTLNGVSVEDYLFTDGDRSLDGSFHFDLLIADNVKVLGNTAVPLKNFDINSFDRRRLSYEKQQVITANYALKHAQANHFVAHKVNGVLLNDLFGTISTEKLAELSKKGELKIKDLYVNGTVLLDIVNGVPSENVLGPNVWQNKFKSGKVSLIIKSNAHFGHVKTKVLDNVIFDDFVKALVFKNETTIRLSHNKTFLNGIKVLDEIDTKNINGVPLQDLFNEIKNFKSPNTAFVKGDLVINSDVAVENINDFSMKTLGNRIEILDGGLKMKGNVSFQESLQMNDLTVEGNINGLRAKEILSNMVFVDHDATLLGDTVFEGPVEINNNLIVKQTVDGVNLGKLMSSVVLKTNDASIPADVVFTEPTTVQTVFDVNRNLYTELLDGCDVTEWKRSALFVNQGLLDGNFTFEDATLNDVLYVDFVNDVDMHQLIPLRTAQKIAAPMHFGELSSYRDVDVGNLVNQRDLETEYRNTVMDGLNQTLSSDVTFEKEVFASRVEASSTIDGRSLEKIVTTYTEQVLKASYNFSKRVSIKGDLRNNGTVNGVDLNDWYEHAVKTRSPNRVQNVYGSWTIDGNVSFKQNVNGDGLIDGVDLNEAVEQLERKKIAKHSAEKSAISDYRAACEDINHILRQSRKQIHLFKYFEEFQRLELNLPLQDVHHFKEGDDHYALASEKGNCLSHLFVLDEGRFVFNASLQTGLVAQAIAVPVGSLVFLVTRSATGQGVCSVNGTNVWLFKNRKIYRTTLLRHSHLLQGSAKQGTFYSIGVSSISEYRISDQGRIMRRVRQWYTGRNVPPGDLSFIPKELKTGLAITNGRVLMRLLQGRSDEELRETINGTLIKDDNTTLPVGSDRNILILNVGIPGKTRPLIAVATQEESSIQKGLDLIKIYENYTFTKLFQNIPTYKPSSLTSIELENGETLLLFLEDGNTLQIYEYKGIEGFKRRSSAKLKGDKLFVAYIGRGESKRTVLGIINKNTLSYYDAVMMGNKLEVPELDCEL